MTVPKKYIHDRVILLLLSTNIFAALLSILLILLNMGSNHSSGYIIQYRANLGLSAFKTGDVTTFLSFMLFSLFIVSFNTVLSIKAFHVRRGFAVAILGMTLLLLVLVIVVSNALLFNNR
ncbi:MAG TPA: hypothetical protein VLE69_03695 [Candidatus Saccharimonadales bacterium]|nr:hypothetical protein [Candidatus Saccharimonadales bacterium]